MDGPPTIRMLALAAGVSKATVSLALRDSPRIRPEVRERIHRLAAEAGYRPNALVANLLAQLRASKTSTFQSTLALVCVARDESLLQSVPTFRAWIAGCRPPPPAPRYRGGGESPFSFLEHRTFPLFHAGPLGRTHPARAAVRGGPGFP